MWVCVCVSECCLFACLFVVCVFCVCVCVCVSSHVVTLCLLKLIEGWPSCLVVCRVLIVVCGVLDRMPNECSLVRVL